MILTAHQPVYLPWLGLFHKIAQADTFVLFDDVRYTPRSFENRTRIWTSQGPQWLTVPVKHSRNSIIKDVEINNDLPWQRKHKKTIEQSYNKCPYFYPYFDPFFFSNTWTSLSALNLIWLKFLLKALDIQVCFLKASDFTFTGVKSELVLDMCKQLGASTYIFGAQGKNYADVAAFERAGIEVRFQDYQHPTYSQFGGPFLSHLSVIDLLFHHGPKAKDILLT